MAVITLILTLVLALFTSGTARPNNVEKREGDEAVSARDEVSFKITLIRLSLQNYY